MQKKPPSWSSATTKDRRMTDVDKTSYKLVMPVGYQLQMGCSPHFCSAIFISQGPYLTVGHLQMQAWQSVCPDRCKVKPSSQYKVRQIRTPWLSWEERINNHWVLRTKFVRVTIQKNNSYKFLLLIWIWKGLDRKKNLTFPLNWPLQVEIRETDSVRILCWLSQWQPQSCWVT